MSYDILIFKIYFDIYICIYIYCINDITFLSNFADKMNKIDMDCLPSEILLNIFDHCSILDIINLEKVNAEIVIRSGIIRNKYKLYLQNKLRLKSISDEAMSHVESLLCFRKQLRNQYIYDSDTEDKIDSIVTRLEKSTQLYYDTINDEFINLQTWAMGTNLEKKRLNKEENEFVIDELLPKLNKDFSFTDLNGRDYIIYFRRYYKSDLNIHINDFIFG